jgi:hypothetical protein
MCVAALATLNPQPQIGKVGLATQKVAILLDFLRVCSPYPPVYLLKIDFAVPGAHNRQCF